MPDTMIVPPETAVPPSGAGILEGYRSPAIGKLVMARAKASRAIKAIVKDKSAEIPSKTGGRGFSYQYADLASVLDAIEEAISEQGLAIFQTTQDRGRGTYLITTLAHESDQWIAAEIRLKSADAGPQVHGSEMTYLRRYAVLAALALAPESDDDGRHAQDLADQQQARQRAVHRAEHQTRTETPFTPRAAQRSPSDSGDPVLMTIGRDSKGDLLIGRWVTAAKNAMADKPEAWRREWLELHNVELEEVRIANPEWADKLESIAVAPDPS